MPRVANKAHNVFRYINMHEGDRSVCWEWTGALGGRDKRPYFSYGGRRVLAYRLVYESVNGVSIPRGVLIRHKCDNKVCCNPDHLVLGTHQQNMDDMKERERHGLPHHVVRAIRRLLEKGEEHAEIAEKFGTSRQTVTSINNKRLYQHVKDEENE